MTYRLQFDLPHNRFGQSPGTGRNVTSGEIPQATEDLAGADFVTAFTHAANRKHPESDPEQN